MPGSSNPAKIPRMKNLTPPGDASRAPGRSVRWPEFVVFGVALALRLLHLAIYSQNPMFRHPVLDPRYYDEWGQRIAGGDWLGEAVFEMAPLYPYFLGALYSVFGHEYVAVCFVQSLLGAATCWLIYRIAHQLFGSAPALVAGVVAAIYPIFVYYDVMIMKTTPGMFLAVVALFLIVRHRSATDVYLAGLALGGAVLVRDNYLAVVPFLAGWYLLKKDWGGRGEPMAAGLLVAGLLTALIPVTLRNYAVGGELVVTTSGGGEVFYIGNNPEATGLYKAPDWVRPDPRFEHEDFRKEARERTGQDLSRGEASRFWFNEGLDWVKAEPAKAAGLYAKKAALVWNRVEVADNYSFTFNRTLSPILSIPIDFGLLAALALLGAYLERRRWRLYVPLLLFAFAYLAGLLPFFYFSRFRVPVTPVWMILAAPAIVYLYRAARASDWKSFGTAAAPAIVFYAFTWLPLVPVEDYRDFSNPLEKLGAAWLEEWTDATERGDDAGAKRALDRAIRAFERSAEIDPDRDTIHFNLGLAYERKGDSARAIDEYEAALRYRASNEPARVRLEALRSGASDELRAEAAELRRQLTSEGLAAQDIHMRVGGLYFNAKADREAIIEFEQALQIDGSLAEAQLRIAIAHSRSGRDDLGLARVEQFMRRNPDHPDGIVVQTGCLMGLERYDEAKEILQRAIRAYPDRSTFYVRLGQIDRVLGNRQEAIEWFEQCLARGARGTEAETARRNIRELRSGR